MVVDDAQGESLDYADEAIVDVWRKGDVEIDDLAGVGFLVAWLCVDYRSVLVPRGPGGAFEVTWNGDSDYEVSNWIQNGDEFVAEETQAEVVQERFRLLRSIQRKEDLKSEFFA